MKLVPEPERRLWQSIQTLERNPQMPYVTSVERFGGEHEGDRSFLGEGARRAEGVKIWNCYTETCSDFSATIRLNQRRPVIALTNKEYSDMSCQADH